MIEKQYAEVHSGMQILVANYNAHPWIDTKEEQSDTSGNFQKSNKFESVPYIWIEPKRNRVRKAKKNIIVDRDYLLPKADVWISNRDKIENYIASEFSVISDIEYIFLSKEKDSLNVWIIMNNLNREIRDSIYDIEFDILKKFNNIDFDFHVICRENKNISKLFFPNTEMIYQR